jgi:hypothetical protein
MSDPRARYTQASIKTAADLKAIAQSDAVRRVTKLSLPEIDAAVDLVSRIIPAGNVPGMILSGLARISGHRPAQKTVQRDVDLLFKGVEKALDKAVYSAIFAGPAAIIWGYQNLLKLAGKDPIDCFPEGTWQFYVDYALREDTARHSCETHGFDTILHQHHITLTQADRVTAWVMASIHCLHQYNALLENEWRERVHIRALQQVDPDHAAPRLYHDWLKQRPYGRGSDTSPGDNYPTYRRIKFDQFVHGILQPLTADQREAWDARVAAAEAEDLPDYRRQMSILAYLDPSPYRETRVPVPLEQALVGVIYGKRYYLIPVCAAGTSHPPHIDAVRTLVTTLVTHPSTNAPPIELAPLAAVKRQALPRLRRKLSTDLVKVLDTLRMAPILLNFDQRSHRLPLAQIRQAERSAGDHALTIFDAGKTFVFDLSHIFFDGVWGAALAEIMTNEALAWAVYLSGQPPAQPGKHRPYALRPAPSKEDVALIRQASRATVEVSVENQAVDLKALQTLRKYLKHRNDQLKLTVNDILLLYRAIHGVTYRPDSALVDELKTLAQEDETRAAATAALEAIEEAGHTNPAVLIPVDASERAPRDRVHPTTFEVPLNELDLLSLHNQTLSALDDLPTADDAFDMLRRRYLATLAGFGDVLNKAKEIARMGESTSVGAIRLMAHLPGPLQRMLDKLPGRFDVLNDIIKGREVFSNVGAVARTSSLIRFVTAKDDNDKKTLAWSVLTDATGVMHITLRDFRPHVSMLNAAGRHDLATRIAQDYLDNYASGFNTYVHDLRRITLASRQHHPTALETDND